MVLNEISLATGPVTWGVDFADTPTNPPWGVVLDDIARSPISAIELGPVGYLPEDADELRQALDRRNLSAVGTFVFEAFHDPARRDHVLAVTERACRVIAAAGGSVLVLIDRPGSERAATAGRPDAARRLTSREWDAMLATVLAAGELGRTHGLRPVFHPHAGSFVEFADEIARLLADTSLDLCLDTGHAAYAQLDPAAAIRAYGRRVAHVHLKDLRRDALTRVETGMLTFWDAVSIGVFCPLGEGVVDLPVVLDTLANVGYDGYATIEQDRVPGTGAPLDDLMRSLAVLERRAGCSWA